MPFIQRLLEYPITTLSIVMFVIIILVVVVSVREKYTTYQLIDYTADGHVVPRTLTLIYNNTIFGPASAPLIVAKMNTLQEEARCRYRLKTDTTPVNLTYARIDYDGAHATFVVDLTYDEHVEYVPIDIPKISVFCNRYETENLTDLVSIVVDAIDKMQQAMDHESQFKLVIVDSGKSHVTVTLGSETRDFVIDEAFVDGMRHIPIRLRNEMYPELG